MARAPHIRRIVDRTPAAAERREHDRVRKRAERAKDVREGKVKPSHADYVITEALAFVALTNDLRLHVPAERYLPVNLMLIIAVATDILVMRFGYSKAQAAAAIKGKLQSRARHKEFGIIPSTKPGIGQPVYTTSTPACLGRVGSNPDSTPVAPSGRVGR